MTCIVTGFAFTDHDKILMGCYHRKNSSDKVGIRARYLNGVKDKSWHMQEKLNIYPFWNEKKKQKNKQKNKKKEKKNPRKHKLKLKYNEPGSIIAKARTLVFFFNVKVFHCKIHTTSEVFFIHTSWQCILPVGLISSLLAHTACCV